jgi:hypothetical protein
MDRFDYRQLDPTVDMHILLAKFQGLTVSEATLGLSLTGCGIAWVDSSLNRTLLRTTVSHETGHALGYVLPGSPQGIKANSGHCSDNNCIMTAVATENPDFLRFQQSLGFSVDPRALKHAKKITDFCTPCKADMHATAEENVDRIRRTRDFFKSVVLGRLL